MNDLISRAWLLDVVEYLIPWDTEKDRNRAIHHVRELAPASRWIPCSEGLPEEDTDVLISYRYKEGEGDTTHSYIEITSYGDMYFGGNPVHESGTGNRVKHWRPPFAYFISNYEVIAWMPLPEPYKEEEVAVD